MTGYFERLVLALGDGVDERTGALADIELGRADEVADVLDDDDVERVERELVEHRADHRRVEVAFAAETVGGVDKRDRGAEPAETLGVERGLDVALDDADPRGPSSWLSAAASSVVFPAPGEDMTFTARTRCA